LLYLSQSEQDSAWEDGGGWYDDRLNACSFLLKLQLRRWGEPVVEGQHVALEGERAGQFPRALVDQLWPAIRRVAKALMSDRVLSEAEIDALIEGSS